MWAALDGRPLTGFGRSGSLRLVFVLIFGSRFGRCVRQFYTLIMMAAAAVPIASSRIAIVIALLRTHGAVRALVIDLRPKSLHSLSVLLQRLGLISWFFPLSHVSPRRAIRVQPACHVGACDNDRLRRLRLTWCAGWTRMTRSRRLTPR